MLSRLHGAVVGLAVAGMASSADAVTIGFDNLFEGQAVSTQYPGVIFGLENSLSPVAVANVPNSPPNGLLNSSVIGSPPHVSNLIITFVDPVNDLSFFYAAENATIPYEVVHESGITSAAIKYDGLSTDNEFINISSVLGVVNITQLTLKFNFIGTSPDLYIIDDLSFTPVAPVPLPAALPLFVSGLVGLGVIGWRKQRRVSARHH